MSKSKFGCRCSECDRDFQSEDRCATVCGDCLRGEPASPKPGSDEEWINNEAPAFSTKGWATGTDRLCIVLDAMQYALAEGRRREREDLCKSETPQWVIDKIAEREEAAAREMCGAMWDSEFCGTQPDAEKKARFVDYAVKQWRQRRAGK